MYRQITDFAPNIDNNITVDPLLYCVLDSMDSQFLHGATGRTFGKYNQHCSQFLSTRCALNWDAVCEELSKDKETRFPDTGGPLSYYSINGQYNRGPCLPYGEQLIRDTAFKKYKVAMKDCNIHCEPFDPTVANSPLVCFENRTSCTTGPTTSEVCTGTTEAGVCQNIYKITPEQAKGLDADPVMNKILDQPRLAPDLLDQIYYAMKGDGSIKSIKNTRLYRYYQYLGMDL